LLLKPHLTGQHEFKDVALTDRAHVSNNQSCGLAWHSPAQRQHGLPTGPRCAAALHCCQGANACQHLHILLLLPLPASLNLLVALLLLAPLLSLSSLVTQTVLLLLLRLRLLLAPS
jgi:hypothetical protein